MIKYLGVVLAFASLIFIYSSFKSEANNVSNPLVENIEKLILLENYPAIYQMVESEKFNKELSTFSCLDKGKISHLIGKAYYNGNQDENAIKYFKKAVFEDWKNCPAVEKKEIANSIFNIGVCYQYTDQIILGKYFIDSAMVLIEKISNYPKTDLAFKYQGAGSYFSELRDFTRAETYLKNATKISRNLDIIDAFYIHIDLLSLYIKFKKYDLANEVIDVINTDFIKENSVLSSIDLATFQLNSAEVYLRRNEFLKAENICKNTLNILPNAEINLLSNAYEILGVIYYKTKRYTLSKLNYEKAYLLRLNESNIVQANVAKSFALENLAELEIANKNFDKALVKINEAIALNSLGLKLDKQQNPIFNKLEISNGFHLLRQLTLKEKINYGHYKTTRDTSKIITCYNLHIKIDTLIDNVLSNAFLDQAKLELLDNMANHSSRAVDVCLELYEQQHKSIYLEKAFYFSSRSKAVLLQKLITSNNQLAHSAPDSNSIEYFKLKNSLNEIQRNLQQDEKNKDSLMKAFSSIQLKFVQFESKYYALKNNRLSEDNT
jgi:hypothetical protein